MIKPHIKLSGGYWKVSPKPKPYHKYTPLWNAAYKFCRDRNTGILESQGCTL